MLNEFVPVGMNKKNVNDATGLDDGLTNVATSMLCINMLFNPSDKIKEFKAAQQKDIEEWKSRK